MKQRLLLPLQRCHLSRYQGFSAKARWHTVELTSFKTKPWTPNYVWVITSMSICSDCTRSHPSLWSIFQCLRFFNCRVCCYYFWGSEGQWRISKTLFELLEPNGASLQPNKKKQQHVCCRTCCCKQQTTHLNNKLSFFLSNTIISALTTLEYVSAALSEIWTRVVEMDSHTVAWTKLCLYSKCSSVGKSKSVLELSNICKTNLWYSSGNLLLTKLTGLQRWDRFPPKK